MLGRKYPGGWQRVDSGAGLKHSPASENFDGRVFTLLADNFKFQNWETGRLPHPFASFS